MDKDNNSNMFSEELQSKTINFLRFPLIVGVVFIHTDFSNVVMQGVKQIDFANYPIFSSIFTLFSKIILEICVPLFYFISGFLFFYKTPVFNTHTYLGKLKKRARSLLIPYVFWNLVVLLLLYLAQTFLGGSLISGKSKLITDYSMLDWLWAFWDTSMISSHLDKSLPINSPFWFIRDLMVVVLFSPLIYIVLKKLKGIAVILLGILWITNQWMYLPGFSFASLFFFAAGAYFSIHNKNFVEVLKPRLSMAILFYPIMALTDLYLWGPQWNAYLHGGGIIIGLVLAIGLSAHFIAKGTWSDSTSLGNSSFFIFAYHRLPLVFVIKFLFKIIHPNSEIELLLLYIVCPAITILLGLLIYNVLKKYLPRFTSLISGGR
ncbi:acyltransferase family protein [Sphingobacterium sp. ML3W]|uniref:acyltransferase family protein n=1 Tax=Sphingobacterium sp. ML3W TaxID=1538644 RepID=UPI000A4767BB|nr:acyltransferase [Sphingobacterium sp. ML3W]